ncbi:hypothetical protein PLICRDRAFT_460600 [Plicaturopsis crispa FD-325 SS-3]|nr:hypothetical protein PLICRDRAFT_460600 [Plicaturopsis crispa FD-325 SS-3]
MSGRVHCVNTVEVMPRDRSFKVRPSYDKVTLQQVCYFLGTSTFSRRNNVMGPSPPTPKHLHSASALKWMAYHKRPGSHGYLSHQGTHYLAPRNA